MADFNFSPFRTTRIMQSEIQEFLDAVSMAVLAYQEGMTAYLKEGWLEASQAVVGAVCGIALARGIKGLRQIRWWELGKIAVGWVSTPISAALICYVMLFIVQNVFEQQVFIAPSSQNAGLVAKTIR